MKMLTPASIELELDAALEEFFEGCTCQQDNCQHEQRLDVAIDRYWILHHHDQKGSVQ